MTTFFGPTPNQSLHHQKLQKRGGCFSFWMLPLVDNNHLTTLMWRCILLQGTSSKDYCKRLLTEVISYLIKNLTLSFSITSNLKLLHTEFCHFVMEKPAWSNESNSLFCSAPSVTKKPTGRLAQSGYRNAPPLVTKKLMDRISKKNLLSKICMVQYVQYLFLKAWMTQIPMNNYLS